MIGSASDVQLEENLQLGENVRNGILIYMENFCAQSLLHECHISFCMIRYVFLHHMRKLVKKNCF